MQVTAALTAGSEEDRDAIASVAAECIKAHLHNEGVDVRTAALWVILNLTEGYETASPCLCLFQPFVIRKLVRC